MEQGGGAELSPAVAKPPHVPQELVYDFDMLSDPRLRSAPHERYRELLADAPRIFWTPRSGGQWILNSHEHAFDAARDTETFSNELIRQADIQRLLEQMPAGERLPQPFPINLDPPLHSTFRTPLNKAFSPSAMMALKTEVRALAVELVERAAPDGRCEFMSAIAEPLPVQVFLKLMGLPLEHQGEYRALVRKQLSTPASDAATTIKMLREMADCMRATILERQHDPRDDLISRLWASTVDGEPMTLEQMENYAVLLFIAGLDTVMNAIGFGICHLAQDEMLQQRLRDDPTTIQAAVEELLRRYSIVGGSRRVAKDTVFGGVTMKKDDRLLLNLTGANLDPQHWPDPTRIDLDREDKAHVTFNVGPHRCVGSHLARMEIQTLYEEIIARLPPFRLDPERPPTFHGGVVLGVDTLNLVWDA